MIPMNINTDASFVFLADLSSLSMPEVSSVRPVQEAVPHWAHQTGWWSVTLFITYVLVLAILAKTLQVSSWGRWELFCCSEVSWLSLKRGTSVNFELLMAPNNNSGKTMKFEGSGPTGFFLCDVSSAGGRRLRSSGRAIWCSSWGGRS